MTGTLALMRQKMTAQLRSEITPGYQPRIELPWPPAALSPNARAHWAAKARAAKSYKHACLAILMQHKPFLKDKSQFAITFCPPNKLRRDLDNLIASFKSGQDALSLITGIDDSNFVVTHSIGAVSLNGCVKIEIADEVPVKRRAAA